MSRIIGHCDRLGYLRCVACHEVREIQSEQAVWSDSGWNDVCDACKKPVGETPDWLLEVLDEAVEQLNHELSREGNC